MMLLQLQKTTFVKSLCIPHVIIQIVNIYMICLKLFHVRIIQQVDSVQKGIYVTIYIKCQINQSNKKQVQFHVNNFKKMDIVKKVTHVYINTVKQYVKTLKMDSALKDQIVKIFINKRYLVKTT